MLFVPAIPEEPTWRILPCGSYTRPLVGSEFVFWQIALEAGAVEACLGFTFKTSLDRLSIEERLLEALGRLRFISPLLATEVRTIDFRPSWVYKQAATACDVHRWSRETFRVVTDCSPIEFVSRMNRTRLPYPNSTGDAMWFRLYLLVHTPGSFTLGIHAGHFLMDADTVVKCLRIIFTHVSNPQLGTKVDELCWGEEAMNLPLSIIQATGGPREGWNVNGNALLNLSRNVGNDEMASHSLLPPTRPVKVPGAAYRAAGSVDVGSTLQLTSRVKAVGFSLGRLLEAVHVLTTFECNPHVEGPFDQAYMRCDPCPVTLGRYLIPPPNNSFRLGSSLSFAPHKVPYKVFQHKNNTWDKLLAIMKHLDVEYRVYMSNPHLPHVLACVTMLPGACEMDFSIDQGTCTGSFTHFGVIEDMIPLNSFFKQGTKESVIELGELVTGTRLVNSLRPVMHTWCMQGHLEAQILACDAWDQQVLEDSMKKFLDIVEYAAQLEDSSQAHFSTMSPVESRL